jgi:hypothetical protein
LLSVVGKSRAHHRAQTGTSVLDIRRVLAGNSERMRHVVFLLATVAACDPSSIILDPPGSGDDGDPVPDPDEEPADPVFEDAHPRIYLVRNRDRLVSGMGSEAANRFRSIVDAQLAGADFWDYRQWFTALVGQLTGDATYCASAVAEIDAFVAAEEASIDAGQRPTVAFDSYLEVGPRIGDVALVYDWCFETTTPDQRSRWLAYAAQTVWNVWHHDDAAWGGVAHPWSGWSVDNPSNNYYYSFLTATMLFGLAAHHEHPDAEGWLWFFRDTKIGDQLVPTFESDLVGGGSREGTGYGVAMRNLWQIYTLWHGSTGEDLSLLTDHARASLLQMLHAIVPTRDRVAPIGDHARDSTAALFDYHRDYIQGLSRIYAGDPIAARARGLLAVSSVPEMDQAFMAVHDFLDASTEPVQPMADLGRAFHAPGNGVLYARSSWDTDATWVNLIAGPYTESHAHRDQGSFMIYKGEWLAHDANVHSNSGIRQEETLHNLVRLTSGGTTIQQRSGTVSTLTALAAGDGWLHAAADLTPAYDDHSSVIRVERELVFVEPDCVVVFDRVSTTSGTQQIWQLNSPVAPSTSGTRTTITGVHHTLWVERVVPSSATTSVHSWASEGEFSGGYRHETSVAGGTNQFLHVLWLDNAVGTVTRSDAGGRIGVTITGSRTVTVRFSPDGIDGSLDLDGTLITLGPTVSVLPE